MSEQFKLKHRVIWKPLPGSQSLALSCPCNQIFYEGTRGPGKTDAQVMFFRKHVGMGYGRFWRGIIFDREYKNLDDLVAKTLRWYPLFEDGARFLSSKGDYKWVWPTGEELLFRQVKKDQDYWNYHGQEFPFIGWNELTKYPTASLYDSMMSCNRTSFLPEEHSPDLENPLPEIPLVIFSTSNPYGPGHNWVKKRFVDVGPPGTIIKMESEVFNPRTQRQEKIVKTQVRLFGSYKENRYLSPEYVAELEKIKDVNKRKAWLWGDWDIVAGGAFDDLWRPEIHILPRFQVPAGWALDRSMDWGSSAPFSVGWWAEADGTEAVLPDGTVFCPPKGSLIRCYEWYGTKEIGTNEGIGWSAGRVAEGIKQREDLLLDQGWILGRPRPGPADNSIFNIIEKKSESIGKKMEDEGVYWTESDKRPGSRINGLQLVRDRLEASIRHANGDEEFSSEIDPAEAGTPYHNLAVALSPKYKRDKLVEDKKKIRAGLYFMDCCTASIATLPVLPRDPNNLEDVDTDAEDHVYDDVRYRVLSGSNRLATSIRITYPS